MFTRIMSVVIAVGSLVTFFAAISYGLNVPEAIALVVFGFIGAFILFAALISVTLSLFGLTKKSLELQKELALAYAEDSEERQRSIRQRIRVRNRFNFWTGILKIIVFGVIFYVVIVGLPLALGTNLGAIRDFFLINPTGSFMMVRVVSMLPMFLFLPIIYLTGFYGPFLIKVTFFDVKFMDPGSEEFNVERKDIIGHEANLIRLEVMIQNVVDWSALQDAGIQKPEQGAIAVGPPGTGKTHTMNYLAGRFGLALVEIKASISKQTFIGVAVIAMALVLWRADRHAKKHNGALILIDEIDGLGQRRSGSIDGMNTSLSSRIISFLTSFMIAPGGGSDDSALIVLMTHLSGMTTSSPFWYKLLRGRINMLMDAIFIDEFLIMPILNRFGANIQEPWRIPAWKSNAYIPKFFLGTTNRSHVLDPALTRPGRLSEILMYDLPEQGDRIALIKYGLGKRSYDPELNTKENLLYLARAFEGKAHVDILEFLVRAWTDKRAALRKENPLVENKDVLPTMEDVLRARSDIVYGLAHTTKGVLVENLRRTAIHEAGHAIVTAGIPAMIQDRARTAKPLLLHFSAKRRGKSLGRVESVALLPVDTKWQSDYEAYISISLASYATELEFWGETTSGAKGDLASATLLAMQMYSFFGWGPRKCAGEEREKYLKRGMTILVANEQSVSLLARESNIQYSPLVREAFGKTQWLNPHFAEEFVQHVLSSDSQKEQIAIILGQALVRSYRFVHTNRKAVEVAAKKLEEEGWEMEGKEASKFFSEFALDQIWHSDDWPTLELEDPFYAGTERGHDDE